MEGSFISFSEMRETGWLAYVTNIFESVIFGCHFFPGGLNDF
jgi:hypothetical protein